MQLFQQIVDGIASGSIYGALALALVLVYRSTGLVNFSQGQMAVVAAYIAYSASNAGLPIVAAVVVAALASAVLGAFLERAVMRRFEAGSQLVTIVVTVALLICLNGLVSLIWGADMKSFPALFPTRDLAIGSVRFTMADLGTIAVLVVVIVVLKLLFQRTRFGLAMRAVAQNPESSAQSGLPVGRLLMSGWALAAVVGAVACCLVAPTISLEPNMMDGVLVYALAAAVLGGLDSPLGSVAAAWGIGIAQNLVGSSLDFIGSDLQIVVPMVLMGVVLLVRPQGLFGRREVARV
ncbi:MAG: branched-chain amino acid ABC transporter permease [Actinomadura sp.]